MHQLCPPGVTGLPARAAAAAACAADMVFAVLTPGVSTLRLATAMNGGGLRVGVYDSAAEDRGGGLVRGEGAFS